MLDGAQIFVDEPADYEPRGDYIVSHWKGQDYVIPISVAQEVLVRLHDALAAWRAGRGEVVKIHAASS